MKEGKYFAITTEQLRALHFKASLDGMPGIHYMISIRYAINILEGMQPEHGEPDRFIQSEINRLQSLLK